MYSLEMSAFTQILSSRLLNIAIIHFLSCCILNVCICFSVTRHLNCFQIVAIENNAVMDTLAYIFWWTYYLFLDIYVQD